MSYEFYNIILLVDSNDKDKNELKSSKNWNPKKDLKLKKLEELLRKRKEKKILIFTQSKETAEYLIDQLQR